MDMDGCGLPLTHRFVAEGVLDVSQDGAHVVSV